MPKTNPSQRPNNYGLYGVLVLLMTAGYHHYFAKKEVQVEVKKTEIAKPNKIQKIKNNQEQAQLSIPAFQKAELLAVKTVVEEDSDFINDNDRENCWDYINRNRGVQDSAIREAADGMHQRLLKKYPSWYLSYHAKELVSKPTVLTKNVIFTAALRELKMVSSWRSDEELNFDRGLKSLIELHKNEPENSAFLIYLALAYDKLGKTEEVEKILRLVKQTTYYSSYQSETMRDMYLLPKDLNEFLAIEIFAGSLVKPNIYKLEKLAKKHDLSQVALQILEKAIPDRKTYDPFAINDAEYGVAHEILANTNPVAAEKYLDANSFRTKYWKENYLGYKKKNLALAKSCEVSTLQKLFIESKEFLAKHPEKEKTTSVGRSVAGK